MIDPKAVTTYAQFNEDIILSALLHGIPKGFYVDVGANDPIIDSVTKLFYDKGWRGINIEPVRPLYSRLEKARPRDTNLNIGIANKKDTLKLRHYIDVSGHSTFDPIQQSKSKNGARFNDIEVEVKTLDEVFRSHKTKIIDFLKIDVEGFEHEVLAGINWERDRPKVICIEANHEEKNWHHILNKNSYDEFIHDGLNKYFIAKEHYNKLVKGYAERAIKLDYHALKQHQYQSWSKDSADLKRFDKIIKQNQRDITALNEQVKYYAALSLKDRGWLSRLKRSVYGLTIDWFRYKTKYK